MRGDEIVPIRPQGGGGRPICAPIEVPLSENVSSVETLLIGRLSVNNSYHDDG